MIGERIGDRCLATTAIPADQAIVSETHAGQLILAFNKTYVFGHRLDYFRTTLVIKNITGLAKKVGKGLTVTTITDTPVGLLDRPDFSPYMTASALQGRRVH